MEDSSSYRGKVESIQKTEGSEMRKEPRFGTQCYDLLYSMIQGETLTPLDALKRFGCMALSQRIGELHRMGYTDIQHIRRKLPNGKSVMTYRMSF